ncbi:MAG: site-specific integrase [Candidatus Bathyarchaeota archaeon]|nr:site-specific integrase [Candidatus Bathyarchaeota archaeon]
MPKIKTKRSDVLRKQEILGMLEEAEGWLACLIALAWIFGKRIGELLRVTKDDVWIDGKFLYVRFHVSKKKTRRDQPIPKPYLKRITIAHPGVPYIMHHVKTVKEGKLFPNMYRELAYYYLKKLNPQAWWHLFRESLATEMAERGATEEQLMHWFDWDRVDTAHEYVKRGTKLTEELSERTW